MKGTSQGQIAGRIASAPMDKQKKKLRDELAQLENYVLTLKDAATRSLTSLQDDMHTHRGSPTAASLVTHLQKQLEELKAENIAMRNAAPRQDRSAAPSAADARRMSALEAECKALHEQVLKAQAREQEQRAALADAQAREQSAAEALADLRVRANATASSSGANGAAARGLAEPARLGAGASSNLAAMQGQLAKLREDKEALEGQVVEMYESFFSDKLVKGIVSLMKKKEATLYAGGSSGAQSAPVPDIGGKPAPKLKAKLDETRAQLEKLEREIEMKDTEFNALQRHHDDVLKIHKLESEGQLTLFKERWTNELLKRKKLHQKVLELKGAIRVFCRVRPLVSKEDGNATSCIVVKDEENLAITVERDDRTADLNTGGSGTRRPPTRASSRTPPRRNGADEDEPKSGREFAYEFDRVFSPSDTQEMVYEDVEDLIVSVADGYNVCIMAYGQTGSGKTYTMQGPSDNPGINTRALKSLFSLSLERKEECNITFSTSILEIYNENIYDLLSDTPRESAAKLEIKEQGGHIWIPQLQMMKVTSMDDVEMLIDRGNRNRSTFSTDMNEHSSRSHLILSMYLRCDNIVTGEKTASKLHLIDLAGSERVSRSHAEGDRLREAQNINSSLSALGDVIQSLQLHKEHIPYRNCKLTRILSDSLGGQSKTLLVVNLSPTRESGSESRCSCDFAIRAKKVELGKATKQVDASLISGGTPSARVSPSGVAPRSFSASRVKSAHQLSADPGKLRSVPHY